MRSGSILLFLCCLFWAAAVPAAHVFTVRDGLPQNAVLALARDGEGFLWAGTEQGLARFDGERFRRLPGLPDDNISALLAEDRVLWVGSYGSGIARVELDTGRIDALLAGENGLPSPFVQDIARDNDGGLWVSSDGGGLARVSGTPGHGPVQVQAFRFDPKLPDGLPSDRVWSLRRGPSGVWASTLEGLAVVRNGSHAPQRVAIPAPFPNGGKVNVEQVLEQSDGALWIATWNDGLYRWQQRSGTVERFAPGDARAAGLTSARVSALAAEPNGRIWVGSERGVTYYEPSCDCLRGIELPLRARDDSDGLFVISLDVDPAGGVWLGTFGEGLLRLAPEMRLFERQRHRQGEGEGPAQGRVRALVEDHTGTLWVGSSGGGLRSVSASARVPGLPWRFTESDPVSANPDARRRAVWALLEDRHQRLWQGSDAGLDMLDATRRTWRHFALDTHIGQNVRAMLEDRRSRLWFGGSGGLAMMDGEQVRQVEVDADTQWGTQDRIVQALAEDGQGRLWVGSVGGLHLLDADGRVLGRFRGEGEGPRGSVYTLLAQLDGSLWVGGSRGLCRTDTHADFANLRWRCLNEHDGLPRRTVYSLAAGNDGGIWAGTVAGLARVDQDDFSVRVHAVDDGLMGDEFAPGAVAAGRDGHLYFGAAGGFIAFDPRSLHAESAPAPLRLTEFSIGNIELLPGVAGAAMPKLELAFPYARQLELRHIDRSFGFRLSALEFDRPQNLSYGYRLVGLDTDWLTVGAPAQASYTGVPPGDYRLEARVRRGTEAWSAPQALLQLHVAPPWWSTSAFRVAATLAGLLLAWAAYRWRLGALARRSRWLAAEVTQRTQALEEQKTELASIAQALRDANARLYELSTRDSLTGVYNRRHALEESERLLHLSDRENRRLVLALIDLDHFKRLNDEHGHLAGDRALAEFGRLLVDALEAGDFAGRYGGEEFVCVLASGGLARARAWAQALAERLAVGGVLWHGRVLPLTVSIGLAEREPGDGLLDAWIARADAALYRAKNAGRNRVECATD